MADLTCPFCNEDDFDAIGLKQHFQRGWCDVFNETPNTDRPEPVKPLAMTKPNLGCAFNCEWPTKCCTLDLAGVTQPVHEGVRPPTAESGGKA